MSFQEDYKFGISKQQEIFNKVSDKFGLNVEHINYKFSKFDYRDHKNNINFELKSRRCKHNDYNTTMIPLDKLESDGSDGSDRSKTILLFDFTDGTYYIEYDQLLFSTFEKKPFKRYDRIYNHNDILKDYVYIPISLLKKI